MDNISLLNIEGTGMIGVPGIAQRLFGKCTKMHDFSCIFQKLDENELHIICIWYNIRNFLSLFC